MTSNGRQPPMENNLQWMMTSNGRRPPMEDDLKLMTTSKGRQPQNIKSGIMTYELEENLKEILSVALLSPACLYSQIIWSPNVQNTSSHAAASVTNFCLRYSAQPCFRYVSGTQLR